MEKFTTLQSENSRIYRRISKNFDETSNDVPHKNTKVFFVGFTIKKNLFFIRLI